MDEKTLREMNKQGLIPGPHEEEEAFEKRCQFCLKDDPNQEMGKRWLQEAFNKTDPLFDIAPQWIPIYFSNHKLLPWEGGCAWIFQEDDPSFLGAFFQLRKNFQYSPTYLKLYHREELIAHELAHVGRMAFDEPRFEEILAYRTSPSWFRRTFGPLVQSSWESALFVLLLLFLTLLDLSLLWMDSSFYTPLQTLKLLPLFLISLAIFRLHKRQRQFKQTLQKLKEILGDEKKASAVIYRLKDKEIENFATWPQDKILDYAAKDKTLRWHLIKLVYF